MYLSLDFCGGYVPRPFAKIEFPRIIYRPPHNKLFNVLFFMFLAEAFFPATPWTIKRYGSKISSHCRTILILLSTEEYYYSSDRHANLRNRKIEAREMQGGGRSAFSYRSMYPKMGQAISYKMLRNSYQNTIYYIPKIVLVIVNIA